MSKDALYQPKMHSCIERTSIGCYDVNFIMSSIIKLSLKLECDAKLNDVITQYDVQLNASLI